MLDEADGDAGEGWMTCTPLTAGGTAGVESTTMPLASFPLPLIIGGSANLHLWHITGGLVWSFCSDEGAGQKKGEQVEPHLKQMSSGGATSGIGVGVGMFKAWSSRYALLRRP